MDAFSLTFFPSSSPFFLSSKPYLPPLLSRLPSSQSRSHPFFKNLPRVSTSDSPSAVVPVEDPIATGDISGEKFDWYSHWYPVAPVCDLDKRAPRAVTVLGLDLVVWWDREEGQWRVFEDRCPHRLAPLSEGRIDPWGRLQCVYHGWCFDGHGNCKLIPQAPADGPAVNTSTKACVSSYPCCVQNNIVWFWPKNEDQCKDILMKYKPPSMSELDDPSYTCTMGMRDIPYGYDVLIENLMDPAHVPYAHHKIMRIRKGSPLLTRDREGGVPVEITIEKLDINGFLAKNQFGYGEFVAPCLYHANFLKGQRRILLIFYCVPVNPGKSRLIWVFPRNFSIWIDQIVPRWMFHVGENLILDSDLYLLHIEERKIADAGSSNWQKTCFVPTKSDAMVITFRRWLKKYSNNLIDWANKVGTHLSPTPPREQLMDRYWTHVVHCRSCNLALKWLRVLEVSLPVISISLIGIVAASKQLVNSAARRTALVSMAVLCFAASRWLSHFIYKTFYFHDYSHAFV
ncbi:hypothetical protein KSP39_PZI002280 [Platanthera zijinensis]|uniref:Rieske domain-containing protein n=1 Tax=Platanthera zijinensis TaxID=2320716 RepID=A0AAP0C1I0_9ASPA